ncbi:hypothetical protein ID866_12262 [Astraeus odoratus]|nr:hypothetical protein ID866_12262 [Astraeus odoratus]
MARMCSQRPYHPVASTPRCHFSPWHKYPSRHPN